LAEMRILVTGGTGFIGSHLVEALVSKGNEVRCIVRGESDTGLLEKLGVELFHGDVTDRKSLGKCARDADVVYHLVGIGDVVSMSEDAYRKFYKINVLGTKNLIEECLDSGIKKFVYMSSVAAIGVITGGVIDEKTKCRPFTAYERSKHEAESLVLGYFEENGFPAAIVRPPMVYGERGEGEVLMMSRLIRRHVLPIIGSGNNLMSLTYVGNVVQGSVLAGESRKSSGETYILSDKKSYRVNRVVETIAKALGVRMAGFHVPVFLANLGALLNEEEDKLGDRG
jgi:nucleoside-diphosphate-sugar epimerase